METFQSFISQAFLGLVNGSFYAVVSIGLNLVFGLLRITNFAHGSFFMLGALVAWMLKEYCGISFFPALLIAPILVGIFGAIIEKVFIRKLYGRSSDTSLLMTFGLCLLIEGVLKQIYGNSGLPYDAPEIFQGAFIRGLLFIPYYRIFVLLLSLFVSFVVFWIIEKTLIGAKLRAIQEKPQIAATLGLNIEKYLLFSFALSCAFAAFSGVLAAPLMNVKPSMGTDIIIVVFAIVVIGGMGSMKGSLAAGLFIGLLEGAAKVFIPEASSLVVFVAMVIVLWLKPEGLFQQSGVSR